MSKEEFRTTVTKCATKAKKDANNKDVSGDPDIHITAYVDGRTKFVQDFKAFGDKMSGNTYKIGLAKVKKGSDGYVLTISGLKGTNIQNHNIKRTLYKKFEEYMNEEGWNMGLEIDQYAR